MCVQQHAPLGGVYFYYGLYGSSAVLVLVVGGVWWIWDAPSYTAKDTANYFNNSCTKSLRYDHLQFTDAVTVLASSIETNNLISFVGEEAEDPVWMEEGSISFSSSFSGW